MSGTPNIIIIDEAVLVSRTGKLTGKALERARENRRVREHLIARQRHLDWREGRPEHPDLARWNEPR